MSGQLDIPGYYFDQEKKRYFKLTPAQVQESKRKVKAEAHEAKSKRGKARKRAQQQQQRREHAQKSRDAHLSYAAAHRTRLQGLERDLEQRRFRPPVWQSPGRTTRCLEAVALANASPAGDSWLPDGLFVDEHITALHVDSEQIRVGGSGGTLLHCNPSGAAALPDWHKDWVLNGPVTSILRHRDTFLASSLGPAACAVMSPINQAASLASTVFKPPKTSIWSAHLDEHGMALGGDDSLFFSQDDHITTIRSIPTKSAVFSITRRQNRVLAGTRSGDVLSIDPRLQYKNGPMPQKWLRLNSSVLHLKPLRGEQVLVSCMDGSMATYDVRSKPQPVLHLEGHVNTHTRDLGLDIWNDSILAAAGSDKRVRLWSLETGQQLTSQLLRMSGQTLIEQEFPDPVKALSFKHGEPQPMLLAAVGEGIVTYQVT